MDLATQVGDRLWLGGSWLPAPDAVPWHAAVTVCHPREALYPPGVREVSRPLDDPGDVDEARLLVAVEEVERHLADGPTLVRCRVGLNRSALVAACVLRRATGEPGPVILDHLRDLRGPDVLCNPAFAAYVKTL